jgi:hypothetical protein
MSMAPKEQQKTNRTTVMTPSTSGDEDHSAEGRSITSSNMDDSSDSSSD